ncbi:hypothetical protein FALBO_8056 [Fusarium albosuccineum]|uniref:BAH domain-containing protein n=1 Tax=Fusarium albosuccineum TaxID=1237068 RepID=A0A8H4LCM9_9HYPO|nr:hypothetical protein FALBO_8056 [Fusarium albosuccineum]
MSTRKRSRSLEKKNYAECPFTVSSAKSLTRVKQCRENKRRKRDSQDDDKRVDFQTSPFSSVGSFVTRDTMDLYYTVEPRERWQDMTRYKNFILKNTKYCSGDFVFVTNKNTIERHKATSSGKHDFKKSDNAWVARILEIRASDKHHVYARVFWMYRPDELPPGTLYDKKIIQGRQPYHGANELIASNHSIF